MILRFPNARDTLGECIAEGPDGRIYVGGGVDSEGDDSIHKLGIACLHKDGTLDTAFGKDGYVVVRFEPMQDTHLHQIHFLEINGQARILLSGVDMKKGENVLARLHADGRPDTDFGVGGRLTVRLPSNLAGSLGLGAAQVTTTGVGNAGPCALADGKIYVVTEVYMPIWIATVAVLIRLNDDGSFDKSFNNTGYVAVTNQHWGNSTIKDVLVQNGKITVCGTLKGSGMVARLNEDGSFDTSFGKNGFAITELSFEFMALSALPEGQVIVAGWSHSHFPRRGVLACFANDGQLDPGFNDGEILIQAFEEENSLMFFGVGVSEGKITASGRWLPKTGTPGFGVARYLSDGTLDRDFGHSTGWVHIIFEDAYAIANAMSLQENGKILVVGNDGPFSKAAVVARFLNVAQG
ncbi:hypothetical protein ACIPIN_04720 [Pseudomonas sp. NPDC087697]|uniref:hypothetical protein n=1 Tax=Pseudomonas sp. NPDC087697 TaxID=3364447 RepID=UPI0037F373EF